MKRAHSLHLYGTLLLWKKASPRHICHFYHLVCRITFTIYWGINKETKYGWNNLTNSVIIVPCITSQIKDFQQNIVSKMLKCLFSCQDFFEIGLLIMQIFLVVKMKTHITLFVSIVTWLTVIHNICITDMFKLLLTLLEQELLTLLALASLPLLFSGVHVSQSWIGFNKVCSFWEKNINLFYHRVRFLMLRQQFWISNTKWKQS